MAARVGILEAGQRRATGQRVVRVGRDVGQDLEQRVVAQCLGIVVVGVAGQDLVDFLSEQRFGGVLDVLGRAGIGKPFGQLGNDPQRFFQSADRQQAGIRDDAPAIESNMDLLRADLPQGKVQFWFAGHDLEPP